jgi:hypothetical protein
MLKARERKALKAWQGDRRFHKHPYPQDLNSCPRLSGPLRTILDPNGLYFYLPFFRVTPYSHLIIHVASGGPMPYS